MAKLFSALSASNMETISMVTNTCMKYFYGNNYLYDVLCGGGGGGHKWSPASGFNSQKTR